MRNSVLSLILSLAGAALLQAQPQPVNPELQQQALELLRQTLSQDRPKPAVSKDRLPPPISTERQQPAAVPSDGWVPAEVGPRRTAPPVPANLQEQAIQRLRETQVQPQPSEDRPLVAPRPPQVRPSAPSPSRPARGGAREFQPRPAPEPPPMVPVVPEQPAGPKTKQQRLAELLEEYRADKLSPSQYQVERAKILAEP